ncbi:MAG: beta-lactamase, partial [Massilibacillus sp.]|nr:beta-lactamase [Massilibacillus sp.]
MKKTIIALLTVLVLITANIPFSQTTDIRMVKGIPVVGSYSEPLAVIDDTMVEFMKLHQIPAATVAIMKDGQILFRHGYGYSDRSQSIPTAPDTLMRIASITKPFTAAAIRNLIKERKISLDSKIMDIIDIQPFKGKVIDPRWYNITIEHLLAHKGGWDKNATHVEFDPGFQSLDIQSEMKLKGPPDSKQIISYMMSRSLDFNPGEKYAYSNFGYAILGRVIEKISGMSYFEYLKLSVLIPTGIDDMELARSLPIDRSPKEIQVYDHLGKVKSVFGSGWVSSPDGGFYIEAMDSYGGLIASAADLVIFAQKFWGRGSPRLSGQTGTWFQYGILDGTYSYLWWRAD